MATPRRLIFPSDGEGEDGDGDISVSDIAKHYSMLAEAEEEETEKTKKTKKKKKSNFIWSEQDEIIILKGLRDYGYKSPDFDWERFFSYAQRALKANVSEKEMVRKIRKLQRNFLFHKRMIEQGNDPLFTRCSDSEAFGYAALFWNHNDDHESQTHNGGEETMDVDEPLNENGAEQIEEGMTIGEESLEDGDNDEMQSEKAEETMNVTNEDEPLNENGAEQTNECRTGGDESREDDDDDDEMQMEKAEEQAGNENAAENREPLHEDDEMQVVNADELVNETGAEQTTKCRTVGEESGEDGADEFWGVRDALETEVLKGLSDDQKKFHLEKMMKNIASGKRKELSDEWKELCSQESRFNAKKLRLRAMVEVAANDG
ncbi:unnamed protein product [Microthlaspi erraticum]|uniref:Glabrous enhancer-binding protein-like DBD domain-containing protein n=1 Tax=Microthlaspi erraticum TaxID=1685480 RepID=A0A6D2JP93_9BRAS|nr:unnamed protein product [Microthlaspi erraticum]